MHEKKNNQCFIPASAKTTRTHLWEQLLLSVVAVFFSVSGTIRNCVQTSTNAHCNNALYTESVVMNVWSEVNMNNVNKIFLRQEGHGPFRVFFFAFFSFL